MDSYVEIKRGQAEIIKVMEEAMPRGEAELLRYNEQITKMVENGTYPSIIVIIEPDPDRISNIIAMMELGEDVMLSKSDARFIADQKEANKKAIKDDEG